MSDQKGQFMETTTTVQFVDLDPNDPFPACDGHASGMVRAVTGVLLPNGGYLQLCGHHARKLGYEHTDKDNSNA